MGRAAVELHRIADDVAAIPDAGLIAAAKLVKRLADEQARRVAGADGLTGNGRRPIKLRARDMGIRSVGGGRAVLVLGQPAGPWSWMTSGTRPHDIRRRKRGPMRKMTVHHPGTRGKGAWVAVIDRSQTLVPRVFTELAGRVVT